MQADTAKLLAHCFSLLRKRAEAAGKPELAARYWRKEMCYTKRNFLHLEFLRRYSKSPVTHTFHDVEMVRPSAPYDSLRTYERAERTPIISAATMNALYSGVAQTPEEAVEISEAARKAGLFQRGGTAVTNGRGRQQWDGMNGWAPWEFFTVDGHINASAQFIGTWAASFLLERAKERRAASKYGEARGLANTGTAIETVNTQYPDSKPQEGEYPKVPDQEDKRRSPPVNFAMRAEWGVYNEVRDPDTRQVQLVRAGGRIGLAAAA
jgi:hypothetical protein